MTEVITLSISEELLKFVDLIRKTEFGNVSRSKVIAKIVGEYKHHYEMGRG